VFNPLVSIIIPVYNGSDYLAEAIDSALTQTYKNIEIIVVNDGSSDNGATERIALSFSERIRYLVKENGGVSSALNMGIDNMKGEYFSWLSHDDLYLPEKIEKQIHKIETDKDIILCSGSLLIKNQKVKNKHGCTLDGFYNGQQLFKKFLKGYHLNGLGFLIPRNAFTLSGLFDESLRYLQDLDMWLRLMWLDFRFVCISDTLVVTRIHQNQVTNTMTKIFKTDKEKIAITHITKLNMMDIVKRKDFLKLYYFLFSKDHNVEGKKLATEAIKRTNSFNAMLIVSAILYSLNGMLKTTYRLFQYEILRIMKVRN